MVKLGMLIVPMVAVASGCATHRPPSDLAHITIERVSSSRVRVERSWLVREHDQLFLVGEVTKQMGNLDTTATHLDLRLFDGAGKVLREAAVEFSPQQIPRGHRMYGHSSFRYELDQLPAETTRFEILAHDGAHSSVPMPKER